MPSKPKPTIKSSKAKTTNPTKTNINLKPTIPYLQKSPPQF
jgi:hypothetical protein